MAGAQTIAPFKGSVRETAPPFAGAVREGQWQLGSAEAPKPPIMPELGQPEPQGAAPVAPISEADISKHIAAAAAAEKDPEKAKEAATNQILMQHSMALSPEDKRVSLRINPDTGSLRTTGAYFVPGDPAHERLLEHTSDYDRGKIPAISQAISRGDPFSFLYRSAEEEEPGGERPTAESRAFEQSVSTAAQRAESSEGQIQRATIVPQQWAVTKPAKDKPRRIMLEGFANDSALNNSQHLLNGANEAGVPVPYQDTGFNYQRDLAGYIQNQQHGFRGDGMGPIVDANNVPNKIFLAEMKKPPGEQYVPHLLSPEKAMFLNAAMNIVPSGKTRPEAQRPTFSENAQWLSRVNQGYIGQEGAVNKLREELDRRLPQVGMRNKKGVVTRHVDWSKGTLEPTYRAYRLDLLEHMQHPLTEQSLRAREGVPHEPHVIMKAPVAVHTAAEFKIPAWQRPTGAAPSGEPPREGFAEGGLVPSLDEFRDSVGKGKLHQATGNWTPEELGARNPIELGRLGGYSEDDIRHFYAKRRGYGRFTGDANERALATGHEEYKRDLKDLSTPIGQDPEMGAPMGEGQAEVRQPNQIPSSSLGPLYRSIEEMPPDERRLFPKVPYSDTVVPVRAWAPNYGRDYASGAQQRIHGAFDTEKGKLLKARGEFKASVTAREMAEAEGKIHQAWHDPMRRKEHWVDFPTDREAVFRTAATEAPAWTGIPQGYGQAKVPPAPIGLRESVGRSDERWEGGPRGATGTPGPPGPAPVGKLPRRIQFYKGEPGDKPHVVYRTGGPEGPHEIEYRPAASLLSDDPEMGAPVGEGQEPGLSENNAQTFEAVSPSIRTDQTYTGAKRALNRPGHAAFKDFNNRVESALAGQYGYNQASSADTVGDWSDGAENTIANESEGQDYGNRRVAAALKAHYSAQKQALLFQHDDEGPHSLYRLKFNTDKDEDVRKLLDEAGIGMRTLYPSKGKGDATQAHVVDLSEDANLLPAIRNLIESGHVTEAWHNRGTGELIGDKNGESRHAAATAYRGILQGAKEAWNQARTGGTAPQGNVPGGDQAPWWDSLQREAEENYAKLRASDDYKKDARAQSLRSAAAHRSQISFERERALAQDKQKAQAWISTAEETNPLSARHFLDKHEEFPEGVEKNEHVGEFFNARNEKLDYNKAEDRSKASDALLHDIMHAISRNSSAVGWYSETVRKAFDKFSEIAPELKTDRASNLAFRLALAITSQGQNVFDNADSAWKAYQYWKQHGVFPTENAKEVFGGGIKSPQMEFNFAKANRLWAEHKGDAESFGNWLNQTIRHGDLSKPVSKGGYGTKIGSTNVDAKVPMSAVFGPKIGVFFQNLSGNEEPVTMDVWFSRTMNRLAANMFGFSPTAMREDRGEDKAHLTTLRELLDSGQIQGVGDKDQAKMRKEIDRLMAAKNLDRDRAMKLAPTIRDWAEKQHNEFAERITSGGVTRGYHPDRKTAEKQNAKNIDENFKALQADPRNGTERANWIKVMDEVGAKMQKAGINMTNADRQALLWYLEQELFQGVTGSKSTSHDYLDAAHDLVRKVKEGSI